MSRIPGAGEDFRVMFQRMSASYWTQPNVRGRRYWAAEMTELCMPDARRVAFMTIVPDFIGGPQSSRLWTTEVELGRMYADEKMVGTFPACSAIEEHMGLWLIDPDSSRLSCGRIVTYGSYGARSHSVKLPTAHELISVILRDVGFNVSTSKPGRLADAIISRMGNVESGCRMFKLRGVRNAIHVLSGGSPHSVQEIKRAIGEGLSASPPEQGLGYAPGIYGPDIDVASVLDWLAEHRIMRPGLKLECTACGSNEWYPLSYIGDTFICARCFTEQPMQRPDRLPWSYKVDGFFQEAGEARGSIPVILTIWRLMHDEHWGKEVAYTTSFEVEDEKSEYGPCECDFGIIAMGAENGDYDILIGEVIGRDGEGKDDIDKLRRFAERLGLDNVYLCVSTIGEGFSNEEKAALRELHDSYMRVIILTRDELEPYNVSFPDQSMPQVLGWDGLWRATVAKYLGDS